jgi:hypothetical protein
MLTLTNKSRETGSFNIDCMFTFIKKRKLKKKIFNEFEKAQREKDYQMVDILGKRYLKIK